MTRTVYRSAIDWWLLLIIIGALAVTWYAAWDIHNWWIGILIGGSMTAMCVVSFFGCWYEIVGNELVVYQFFRPYRFPISKIMSVRKTNGYLATAGMSHHRVSISFTDRTVLKSYAPLEISPRRRSEFMASLHSINPDIKVLD